ncbi:hypothetical protein J2W48_003747 [Flavobacterium piscis]|uniref:Uncharacterized protein n=1 Tax=Flavobacterium piscis TaxID=1114874 RepID=A0ABU1YC22_9FLAO|nr:hypothetical protein [Flavobacterium piscis]
MDDSQIMYYQYAYCYFGLIGIYIFYIIVFELIYFLYYQYQQRLSNTKVFA